MHALLVQILSGYLLGFGGWISLDDPWENPGIHGAETSQENTAFTRDTPPRLHHHHHRHLHHALALCDCASVWQLHIISLKHLRSASHSNKPQTTHRCLTNKHLTNKRRAHAFSPRGSMLPHNYGSRNLRCQSWARAWYQQRFLWNAALTVTTVTPPSGAPARVSRKHTDFSRADWTLTLCTLFCVHNTLI